MITTTTKSAEAPAMPIAERLEHCAKFTGLDAVRELLLEAAQAVRKRDAVIRQATEALENASPAAWASRVDSDTMKSIWRKHAEALVGLQALLAELGNTACKSVQKRLAAPQPAQATQAEVTGEPVYQICKKDSQSISSAWIDVEKQAYEDAGIYPEYGRRTLYTHPAPSVPADVVRDAERYRWLADCNNYEAGLELIIDPKLTAHTLGEKIDAAMLAAKKPSA